MLFNSPEFLFFFLPITLIGYFVIGSLGRYRIAISWLVVASLFFYGWWNPAYVFLIVASILFNYAMGVALLQRDRSGRRTLLVFGVAANLGLLGYFKYAGFLTGNLNALTGASWSLGDIVLPLAISFFTFQQITYLVDAYRGETRETDFLHYCLFVTFFPQLIAGPIVHHKEMLPQFGRSSVYHLHLNRLAVGLTIFLIGLFKKVVIADGVAVYATPVFDAAELGAQLTYLESWGGALAYTFQLYFDFSGYSDMAIGLGYMFGIRLPLNFNSPYKATSIIDFWRRWHMTLSRFLREYVYIPLGGSRKSLPRRYVNLMITMLLGGLWHGAGWTFVIWGALHGFYLLVNHAWRLLLDAVGYRSGQLGRIGRRSGLSLTFIAVVVSWVVFRAESIDGAMVILKGMAGMNGVAVPASYATALGPVSNIFSILDWDLVPGGLPYFGGLQQVAILIILLGVCWLLPNSYDLMRRYYRPVVDTRHATDQRDARPVSRLQWRMRPSWAVAVGALASLSMLALFSSRPSEFLYFQF